jgi:HEAT repeat protein
MLRKVIEAVGRANQGAGPRAAATAVSSPTRSAEESEETADVEIDLGALLRKLAAMRPPTSAPAEELNSLMGSIRAENYPREIALVLSELLEAETRLDAYSEIADELERRCRQLMAENDRAAVLIPLSTFARHAGSRGLRPAGQEVRAAAAVQALGVDNMVSFLADLLRTATPAEAYAASELVAMVSLQAPGAVVQLLSEPLPSHSEAAIASALIKMGAASVPALAKVVRDRDVGAAVSAVRILSQVPGSESLRALEHGLESDDTAIRLAIVQCVGRTQRTEAAHILLRILSDPDLAIRRAAAESLGRLRFEPAVHALSKIAESRSLGSDALTERLTAIDALGKIGGGDAIAALARILVRHTWLRKTVNDRVRVAAVRALARINTAESLEVIGGFRRDSRPAVRQACQMALDDSAGRERALAAQEG